MDTCPRFPVEPELDTRHETFQRIFGRAGSQGAGRTLRLTVNAIPYFLLNPDADSTGFFHRGLRGYLGCGIAEAIGSSIRVIRAIRGSIFPLVAVVCSFSFSSSVTAQTLANPPALDSFDCITADDLEEKPTQICENSPVPWNDLDEISLPMNDKAVIPSRYGQSTPQTTGTTLAPITLQPGLVPAFLFPAHSSDSAPEHIHERAPPSLA